MSDVRAVYSLMSEVERVRSFLHGRVKSPELEIAVSRDLGLQLKIDYIVASRDPNLQVVGIPPLAGHRIFVDGGLQGLEFRVVLVFKKQDARKEENEYQRKA